MTQFSKMYQPRRGRRFPGDYWRYIPIQALTMAARHTLANLPKNVYLFDAPPLVSAELQTARIVTIDFMLDGEPKLRLRPTCRHLIAKARHWRSQYEVMTMFADSTERWLYAPENESAQVEMEKARAWFRKTWPNETEDPFPFCPFERRLRQRQMDSERNLPKSP